VILVTPLFEGEVDLGMLELLSKRAPLGLDIQGFVRVIDGECLVFRPWKDLEKGLRSVTYLKVDRAEAECLTGLSDCREAAVKLAGMGPREIVLTQTSGVTVYAGGEFHQAPFTPRSLEGRTGRGDTCFSTYVAWRLDHSAEEACRLAAAITTLKQEKAGPWQGNMDDVETLLSERKKLV
jgi:sugar/nucleoside kinase (ribokinase family)